MAVGFIGTAVASTPYDAVVSQNGPAKAASTRGILAVGSLGSGHSNKALSASDVPQESVTYYAAPFMDSGYYGGTYSNTVQEAIDKWWATYQIIWAGAFPGCTYTSNIQADGSETNVFALIAVHGTCGGEGYIFGTAYSQPPGKNLGDGGGCDGGEGTNGGGGGSGAGGNGATPDPTCPSVDGAPVVADPINASTGDKYLQDDDYLGNQWLTFRRFYNSDSLVASSAMGSHWRHSFDRSLEILGAPATSIVMFRPDGKQQVFTSTGGQWKGDADNPDILVENDSAQGVPTSYTVFIAALRQFETYGTNGLLQTVTDETGVGISLTYSSMLTSPTVAPSIGLLLTVSDPTGRQLAFTYDSNGMVHEVTLPDGGMLTYSYDTVGNLLTVQYPDGKTRQYVYNESSLTGATNLPNAMTGIVDEAGVRYENTTYDSTGRATSSSFAGNIGNTQITYNTDGTSSVLYPLGISSTLGFSTVQGVVKVASLDQPCGPQCGQPWKTRTYDVNSYPSSYIDFSGNTTLTTHDAGGLLDQRISASGSVNQSTTNITWDAVLRNPLTKTVLDAQGNAVTKVTWVYNTRGQPLARCEIDPATAGSYVCAVAGTPPLGVRRWTYQYCNAVDTTQCPIVGLLLSMDGPRTDVSDTTSFAYYLSDSATSHHGDLKSKTDALGHVTTYSTYDGAGRPTRIADPNGVITDLVYTARGWLQTRTVRANASGAASAGDAITTISYSAFGAVASVTDPDGFITRYGYDTAHRLTRITDALGNYIRYTLDAAGNRTGEQTYTASGTLTRSLSRQFNALGQLYKSLNAQGAATTVAYDANGNATDRTDPLGIDSHASYDALNRLYSTVQNYGGADPATANTTTGFTHDALDRLTQVTDPSGLSTSYGLDGLSNLSTLASHDSGTTQNTYDAAGNLSTRVDARGVTTTYTYDALNRPTGVLYPAHPTLNVHYTYDQAAPVSGCPGSFNIGHLTSMTDASGSTAWCYTNQGDIREVKQVINGFGYLHGYAYSPGRRMIYLQYPSGFELVQGYDGNGRLNTIGYVQQPGPYGSYTTITITPLITSVSYLPFGPMSGYVWAQGSQSVTRTYDANYWLTDLTSPALNLHFARDALGDVKAEGATPGASPASENYLYDPLYRLKELDDGAGSLEQAYTYNGTGDRLTQSTAGQAQVTYGYLSGTHQLNAVGSAARTPDANGNTTAMTDPLGNLVGLGYDDRNLLTVVQSSGTTIANYQYDGLGVRVWRTITSPSAGTAATVYDPTGTGNLYGEYFAADFREYVYVNGIPVAAATDPGRGAPGITYLYADRLGTIRAATAPTGGTAYTWAWQNNAFGNQLKSGGDNFYNRFPGQYYDVETGLHYNVHRYYDPATGRYIQSDPIGLAGGASTYAYVGGTPLNYRDPSGLINLVLQLGGGAYMGVGGEGAGGAYLTTSTTFPYVDAGVYGTLGGGGGQLIGSGLEGGLIKGNESDIQGVTLNAEGAVPGVGGEVMFSGGEPVGFVIGPAAEEGFAVSGSKTWAFGLNDVGDLLGGALYEHFHPYNPNCQ
jgi:RHS repeat-associated protein